MCRANGVRDAAVSDQTRAVRATRACRPMTSLISRRSCARAPSKRCRTSAPVRCTRRRRSRFKGEIAARSPAQFLGRRELVGGGASIPRQARLYVPSRNSRRSSRSKRRASPAAVSNLRYMEGAWWRAPSLREGLPLFKPPYSRMTADLHELRRARLDDPARRRQTASAISRVLKGLNLRRLAATAT